MKRTRDREINAINIVVKALRPLESAARGRVMEYALTRLAQEEPAHAQLITEGLPREVDFERMNKAVNESANLSPRKTQPSE